MSRPLPRPTTTADMYAAATYELLSDIRAALLDIRDRLPRSPLVEPVAEPAAPPEGEVAVLLTEPAQPSPPARPVRLAEPARPTPPPRFGRGSSEAAWRAFAEAAGVELGDITGRDAIVAACQSAGVLNGDRP